MSDVPTQTRRNKLTIDDFLAMPEGMSPEEVAAYKLAVKGHAGKMRHKVMDTGDVQPYPYEVHLNLVHHLLQEAGVSDKRVMAAAYMHDMIEDCSNKHGKRYNYNRLKSDYAVALKAELVAEGSGKPIDATFVAQTVGFVREVSNPEFMPGGKRTFQTDKMRSASAEAKWLKIADQAASIIEDVMIQSALPDEKLRVFMEKARDVVVACEEDNVPNKNLRAMEDEPYRYAMSLLDAPLRFGADAEAYKKDIRAGFDLDKVIARAKKEALHLPVVDRQFDSTVKDINEAHVRISLMMSDGHVQAMRLSWEKGMDDVMTHQISSVLKSLERSGDAGYDEARRAKTLDGNGNHAHSARSKRDVWLSPPMPVDDFMDWAAKMEDALRDEHRRKTEEYLTDATAYNPKSYRGVSFTETERRLESHRMPCNAEGHVDVAIPAHDTTGLPESKFNEKDAADLAAADAASGMPQQPYGFGRYGAHVGALVKRQMLREQQKDTPQR